jgi:signal transduction histidine kinase/DNA-binding response OmpR family regulator
MDLVDNIMHGINDPAVVWKYEDKKFVCQSYNDNYIELFKLDDYDSNINDKITEIYSFINKKYMSNYTKCIKKKRNQEYNVFHDGNKLYFTIIYIDDKTILELVKVIKVDENELMDDPFNMILIVKDKKNIYNANFLFLRNTEYQYDDIVNKNVSNFFTSDINFHEYNKISSNNIILKNKKLLNVDLYIIKLNGIYDVIIVKDISCIKNSIINDKILKNINTGLVVFDKTNDHFETYNCINCNLSFMQLFSINELNIVGKNILDIFNEDIYYKIKKSYQTIITDGNYLLNNIEYNNRYYNFNCFIIEDHLLGIIIVDITDSVEIKSLQYSKNSFIINIINNLRKPVYCISKTLSFLNETKLNIEQIEYINKTIECNESLSSFINDLTDYTNIKTNKIRINNEIFNIREEINQCSDLLLTKTRDKNLGLNFTIDNNIPAYIIFDKNRFKQIFMNILSNALKFTNKGSIDIEFKTEYIKNDKYNLFIKVSDTGIGIEEKKIDKIFDSFYQGDDNNNNGFGLGLSICKGLCKILNGNIWVTSKHNIGSTFHVVLPIKEFTDINRIEEESIDILKNKTVIIIDRDPKNRVEISKILTNWTMKSTVASTSEEALLFFNNNHYDLCFIDIDSMDTEKLNLVNKIKEINQFIPIIAMIMPKNNKNKDKKFNYILEKPIDKSKLINLFINIFSGTDILMKKFTTEDTQINNDMSILLTTNKYKNKIKQALNNLNYTNINSIGSHDFKDISIINNYDVWIFDTSHKTTYSIIKKINKKYHKPYIIAMIELDDRKNKKKYKKYGVDAFISKPLDISELEALIRVINRRIKNVTNNMKPSSI